MMDKNGFQGISTASILIAVSLVIVALVIAAWDIFVAAKGAPEASVSNVLYGWAKEHPILPLVFGVIVGHVFWR